MSTYSAGTHRDPVADSYVIRDEGNGLYRRIAVTAMNLYDERVAVFSGLSGTEHVVSKGAVLVNEMIND